MKKTVTLCQPVIVNPEIFSAELKALKQKLVEKGAAEISSTENSVVFADSNGERTIEVGYGICGSDNNVLDSYCIMEDTTGQSEADVFSDYGWMLQPLLAAVCPNEPVWVLTECSVASFRQKKLYFLLDGKATEVGIGQVLDWVFDQSDSEDCFLSIGNRLIEEASHPTNRTIFDVADWFLSRSSMSHKKLQKLCYYAEAWTETLIGSPISEGAKFEAWAHGPVNRALWEKYKDYGWEEIPQKDVSSDFSERHEEILESVWLTYGDLTGTQLENLTRQESPWKNQRKGLPELENSESLISVSDMIDCYKTMCG